MAEITQIRRTLAERKQKKTEKISFSAGPGQERELKKNPEIIIFVMAAIAKKIKNKTAEHLD